MRRSPAADSDPPREVELGNARLRLACVPQAGGKVVSLQTPGGAEWLWSNPRLPLRRPVYGSDYGRELDSGGWDELLPSVAPSPAVPADWPGAVPDHGEFVGLAWSIVPDGIGPRHLSLAAHGRQWPLRLGRTLIVDEAQPAVCARYTLENVSSKPLPYLYAAHLLLAAEQGAVIELPAGQEWRIYSGSAAAEGLAGACGRWPTCVLADGTGVELGRLLADRPHASNVPLALKVFVRTPADGRMRVRRGDGSTLTLRVDRDELPWIGLWINRGGWAGTQGPGYLNLGLEPTTAPTDDLQAAIHDGSARWIEAGATAAWSVQLDFA